MNDFKNIEKKLSQLKDRFVPSLNMKVNIKEKVFSHISKNKFRGNNSSFGFFLKKSFTFALSMVLIVAFFVVFIFSNTQKLQALYIGELGNLSGQVYVVRENQKLEIKDKFQLQVGDIVEVANKSNAEIKFYNNTKTKLVENTKIKIREFNSINVSYDHTHEITLELEEGSIEGNINNSSLNKGKLTISTKNAIIEAKEDSSFLVALDSKGEKVSVTSNENDVKVIEKDNTKDNVIYLSYDNKSQLSNDKIDEVITSEIPKQDTGTLLLTSVVNNSFISIPRNKVELSEKKEEIVNNKLDLEFLSLVDKKNSLLIEIKKTTDIAKVKLYKVINQIQDSDESGAKITLQSYFMTLSRMNGIIGEVTEKGPSSYSNKVIDVENTLKSRPLRNFIVNLTNDYIFPSEVTKNFILAQNSLRQLQNLEESVILNIISFNHKKLLENEKIDNVKKNDTQKNNMIENMNNLEKVKETTLQDKKQDIDQLINQEVDSKLEVIQNIKDKELQKEEFGKFINEVPNAIDNYDLLDDISKKVPDDLKGYVKMKQYQIKYNYSN